MKTTGIVFMIIGGLAFMGASIGGHSVVGPIFWLALGAYLVHMAEEESKEKQNDNKL